MTKRALLLTALLILALYPATARGFEFHLLSGMIIGGDLTGFENGIFTVKTDFGNVSIETEKLDFILVEESDADKYPSPAGPGMGVVSPEDDKSLKAGTAARGAGQDAARGTAEKPKADTIEIIRGMDRENAGVADAPKPLDTLSADPETWPYDNDDAGGFYPGRFRGEEQ